MSATTLSWEVLTESVRGSTHVQSGLPNQDAVATRLLDEGPATIVAVADGHGGQRYVRSDIGSGLAVRVACEVFGDWWINGGGRRLDASRLHTVPRDVGVRLVARWRESVLDHVATNPFTPAESERAGTALESDPVVAYGATVLVAVADVERVLLVQLGDGDIFAVQGDGTVVCPVPGDDRLVAGQTTSLCLAGAENDLRSALLPADLSAELVVLCSDGYGNSFADDAWAITAGRDLHDQLHDRGITQVEQDLKGWLRASAEVGGDDVTVALLARTNGARAPTGMVSRDVTNTRASRPRRVRRALFVAGVVTALLIGTALGWFARGSDDGENASVEAPPVSTGVTTPAPVPEPAESTIVGPAGSAIRFTPDLNDPGARATGESAGGAVVTRLLWDGTVWEIDDRGRLTARASGGRTSTITLDEPVGSMVVEGSLLWVVARDEARLFAVDPGTREPVAAHAIGQTALEESPGSSTVGSDSPVEGSEGQAGTSGGGQGTGR